MRYVLELRLVGRPGSDGSRRRPLRLCRGACRESEHGQEQRLQRAHRAAPAHRQLARQDRHPRGGRLPVPRSALQARRPARNVLAALHRAGRGDRPRFHPLRPSGLHDRRGRRHVPGAQPEPRASGARDQRSRGPVRQPDGRSSTQAAGDRRGRLVARPRRARRRHERANGRRPAVAARTGRAGRHGPGEDLTPPCHERRRIPGGGRRTHPDDRAACPGPAQCALGRRTLARWRSARATSPDRRRVRDDCSAPALPRRTRSVDRRRGGGGAMTSMPAQAGAADAEALLARAAELRHELGATFRDDLVEAIYHDAAKITGRAVTVRGKRTWDWDQRLDRLITSPVLGLPLMLLLLAIVFWLTISGANYPSRMLASGLFWVEGAGSRLFESIGAPWWLTGLVWHGVYRCLAWVVSVMLPPMAIFFPLFTILEDLGYLPRVAFNLDRLFKKAGAHGKQVLTMSMGFGCNAAGVIACRTIDSPRERLIAILTNNFVPCNGRWPTIILLATVFVGAAAPPTAASAVAAGSVVMVVLIGFLITLLVSAILSRTVLKGEPSAFTLELPPYRRPSFLRIIYTSMIDRTLFVLWRAIIFAAPAGAVIWLLANTHAGGSSIAQHCVEALDPLGRAIGLDGVILLAYVIAIPANEIVVPTILMLYLGQSMMTKEFETAQDWRDLFVGAHGWTLLTAVNLILFSLLHNPCSTTIYTMWKETKSAKWTTLGALMPLALAFAVTFLVAQVWRLLV
ncbi:MAG: hypothetical protein GY715_11880 [Planctomycetes bacterium]|nr:hypothetical protein [Planctomycetota bacterium]